MISCRILCKNTFNLFVYFFLKNTEIKVKSFECHKSKKNNTWNIRRLVDDSFVQSAQRPSVEIFEIEDDFKKIFDPIVRYGWLVILLHAGFAADAGYELLGEEAHL